MDFVWYIEIISGIEGPFSKEDLKKDSRITPDTYAWREGFDQWKKVRDIPELDDLFEEQEPIEEEKKEIPFNEFLDEEIVLANRSDPPPYIYWLLLALIIVAYFTYSYLYGMHG